ncbi:LOW QUALITY PROTEIN: putative KHDC1-like protein [Bos indicus x Bos taurus]|uniref:LOW QUALITY PROTEIN: putative KHDC1-like protein n=1 Tax=Bos indicus x Bos taurus TaxID=30522 RepID=UPI000F7D5217|nr:LOW QUALITY PROTEIN: putative KHDC1-like protein [Bos indicus x Bos taurus]
MELKSRWWTVPEHFAFPLEFYIERDQEELIYIPGPSRSSFPCPSSLFAVSLTPPPPGHLDADLLRLGAHSQTFIQRERGFAATGLTRVLLVASLESRQWLFLMVWRVSSRDPKSWGRGLELLQLVRSQPLTTRDLAAAHAVPPGRGLHLP